MRPERVCSECGASIEHLATSALSCGDKCRQARRRRTGKLSPAAEAQALETVSKLVYDNADGTARKTIESQLMPIVREAIDGEVTEAIARLVKLTPRAVALLSSQLDDPNPGVAQRAAALVIKYTIGHPALVQPADKAPPQMEVHFNLPRPEAPDVPADAETVTSRACDTCGEIKTEDQFESGSDRCTACFDEWKAKVAELAA